MVSDDIIRFNEVNFALYIQIKGTDGKWSLIMFDGFNNNFTFFGFSNSPVYLDKDEIPSRKELNDFISHYSIKDKGSLEFLTDKSSKSLALDSFLLKSGELRGYGVFIDDGEAIIRFDNFDVIENVKSYSKEKLDVGDGVKLTKVKLKTCSGLLSINVSTDGFSYGWCYNYDLN